jgi:ribose/xylose/arabinose/galactoside ABC-type transport system permease subunit
MKMSDSKKKTRIRIPLFVAPLLALVLVVVLFAVLDNLFSEGKFLTAANLSNVSIQTCVYAIAAVGLTVVIISGGIDLSCGTAVTLSATVVAWCIYHDVGERFSRGAGVRDSAMELALGIKEKIPPVELAAAKKELIESIKKKILLLESQEQPLTQKVKNRDWEGISPANRKRLKEESPTEFDEMERTEKDLQRMIQNQRILNQRIKNLGEDDFWISIDEARQDWGNRLPNHPSTVYIAILAGLLTGTLSGLLNGILISFLRIVPFVVTLGTMTIFLGIGNLISGNVPIRTVRGDQVPEWLYQSLSLNSEYLFLGLPPGVWTLALSATLVGVTLWATVFGRYSFALGSNESTARLCGINVSSQKLLIYSLSGALIGLAGVFQFSRLTVGDPEMGLGLELKVIAAVVIGGGSLTGGRGSIVGTLCGAAMLAVILNGCTQLGLPVSIEKIVVGSIIIFAVYLDQPAVKQFLRRTFKKTE